LQREAATGKGRTSHAHASCKIVVMTSLMTCNANLKTS